MNQTHWFCGKVSDLTLLPSKLPDHNVLSHTIASGWMVEYDLKVSEARIWRQWGWTQLSLPLPRASLKPAAYRWNGWVQQQNRLACRTLWEHAAKTTLLRTTLMPTGFLTARLGWSGLTEQIMTEGGGLEFCRISWIPSAKQSQLLLGFLVPMLWSLHPWRGSPLLSLAHSMRYYCSDATFIQQLALKLGHYSSVPITKKFKILSPVLKEPSKTKCHQLQDCLEHKNDGEHVVTVLQGFIQRLQREATVKSICPFLNPVRRDWQTQG